MELIPYTSRHRDYISDAIEQFGYAPEHNPHWFENGAEEEQEPYLVRWKDGSCIMAYKEEDAWYTLSEPVCRQEDASSRVCEFAREILLGEPDIKKIVVEHNSSMRREMKERLAPDLKVRAINYTLIWPVTVMANFDPTLSGKKWKSIRHARNKFYREHEVRMVDARTVDAEDFHTLIEQWEKTRGQGDGSRGDTAYTAAYHAMAESKFPGCDGAHAMIVDGRLVGFNAGWLVPHSERYYGAMGVHDYSLRDLGEMLYLEDLLWIKQQGYPEVDMAGGEKELTHFKNHFHPDSWYKTHSFSIARS